MTVTSKWVALHEVSDYLAKGWREVKLEGGLMDAAPMLMVSPEEPASPEVCPNCGGIVEEGEPHRWRHPNAPDTYSCRKPASEPTKVVLCKCGNCGENTAHGHTEPAQPEPVAEEMLPSDRNEE